MDENADKPIVPVATGFENSSHDGTSLATTSHQSGENGNGESSTAAATDANLTEEVHADTSEASSEHDFLSVAQEGAQIKDPPPVPGILGSSLGQSLRRNLRMSFGRKASNRVPAMLERIESPVDKADGEITASPQPDQYAIVEESDESIETLLGRFMAASSNSSLEKLLRMHPRQRFGRKADDKNQDGSAVADESCEDSDEEQNKLVSAASMRKTASNMVAYPTASPVQPDADKVVPFPITSVIAGFAVVGVFAYGLLQPLGLRSEDLSEGTGLLTHGKVDRALVYFDKAVHSHPSANALAGRAAAYEKLGKPEKAFSDYEAALKLDPENLDAALYCADSSLATKQYDNAITFYLRYLDSAKETNPNAARVRASLADAYKGSGKYSRALSELNHVKKTEGDNAKILFKIADCHYALRRYELAKDDCSKVIALDPQSYDALLLRGKVYGKVGDNKDALTDFNRAIAMRPQETEGLIARGIFYADSGNFAKAFQDLNHALTVKPEDLKAYAGLVKANIANGQPLKGLQLWEDVSRSPRLKADSTYYTMSGDIYAQAGLYAKAVTAYKKGLELDPGNRSSLALPLSECYGKQNDYKQAVLWASNALSENPDDPAALIKHGEYSYLIGNKLTALANFSRAIELEPDSAEAFMQRGSYFLSEKNYYSAKKDFEAAWALQPSLPKVREKIAFCQSHNKVNIPSQDVAVEAPVQEAISLTKDESKEIANANLGALQKTGYAALSKGRVNYALAAFTRAIKLSPNDPHSRLYMSHALLQAGYPSEALKQFYVLEQISTVGPSAQIAFATALAHAGAMDDSQNLFDHVIAIYSNNPKVLLTVAKVCADLDERAQVLAAGEAGTKCASREDLVEFLKITGQINGVDKSPKIVPAVAKPS